MQRCESSISATATLFGADFWVVLYGEGFVPELKVHWNCQLCSKFYNSPTPIYLCMLGSDINDKQQRRLPLASRQD